MVRFLLVQSLAAQIRIKIRVFEPFARATFVISERALEGTMEVVTNVTSY